jgi:hypothetical protein
MNNQEKTYIDADQSASDIEDASDVKGIRSKSEHHQNTQNLLRLKSGGLWRWILKVTTSAF